MENIENSTSETFKNYIKALKASFRYSYKVVPKESFSLFLTILVTVIFPFVSAFFYGRLINEITLVIRDPVAIGLSIFITFGIYSVADSLVDIFSAVRSYFNSTIWMKFQIYMDIEVLRKREEIDIAHYENPKFQDLYQRAFVQSFYPFINFIEDQFNMIKSLLSIILGSVLALTFNPWIYLIIFTMAIPKFVVEYKYGNRMWSIWAKDSPEQRRFSDLRRYFTSRYSLIETKMLQSRNYLLNWASGIITDFNNKKIKAEKTKIFGLLFTEVLSAFGFAFGIYLILQDVLSGKILLGSMVYFMGVVSTIRYNFGSFLSTIARQNQRTLLIGDLLEFFNTKPFIEKSKNPVKLDLSSPPDIVFENVSFKYPNTEDDKLIIKNLNLEFKGGFKVGLVGNNGAGKTTIVKLICRIYDPSSGRILINGVDLKDLDLDQWWGYLGVMFQDYASYDFPVKDAIAIGRSDKELDIDLVKKTASIAQADEFIDKWESGYDTALGVEFGGKEPSKGQRQKLAIAKILYRQALVVILDEPTASVDAESESKIFKSLNDLPNSQTSILISHDFSMIKECDQIFVLEDGMLKEEGTHSELLKNKSLYAELFKIQAEGFK